MTHELAVAFAAGLVAFFSPCSVALVPAYVALYLPAAGEATPRALSPRFVFALMALLGASATAVVAAVFAYPLRSGGARAPGPTPEEILMASAAAVAVACAAVIAIEARRFPPGSLQTLARETARGAALGGSSSLGFVTVFGAVALLLAFAGAAVAPALPAIALITAGALLLLGILMILGRSFSILPAFAAPSRPGYLSAYVFGLAYALISTGCLLPVFLAVVNFALLPGSVGPVVMLAYAAGYAALMILLSVYVAVARETVVASIRRALPQIHRVAGAVVVAMAAYVIWFDVTAVMLWG